MNAPAPHPAAGKTMLVDANYRFIAASQEMNTRIAQRQQALNLFVTLAVSLLAALVALRPDPGHQNPLPTEWLVLGFPTATFFLALLNYKAERTITHLRSFLASLERLGNRDLRLPGYNTDPRWASSANSVRRFQDYAAAVLAAGGNGMGIAVVWRLYPERLAETPALWMLTLAGAVLSTALLLIIPRWSYRPAPEEDGNGSAA